MTVSKIIYTKTDEAPLLATYSLLPIIKAFTEAANIKVETRDISLAARIICTFPENLNQEQKITDDLKEVIDRDTFIDTNLKFSLNISGYPPF